MSVTVPPIVAAASAQSRPIGPPPITATESLASTPAAATVALYATENGSTKAPWLNDSSSGILCSHDAIARPQRRYGAPDLGDLAGPLVARDDRVRDRDDVAPFEELEVRVADPD